MKEALLYEEILKKMNFDRYGREKEKAVVSNSDILVHGKAIPFSSFPFFINEKDEGFFSEILEKIQTILDKMTKRYIEDQEYRKIFNFSDEMEKLICLPCNYDSMIPVGRYALFLDPNDEKDFWFCEFNTDGTGGMSRDALLFMNY